MMIKVLTTGLYSSVQDEGRFGYRKFGVPLSGTMDLQSAAIANKLVGNPKQAALLEITAKGPVLLFNEPAEIAITGALFNPTVNSNAIALYRCVKIEEGQKVAFGHCDLGLRGYVAVRGGFQAEEVLGSASYYRGITPSWKLEKGSHLVIGELTRDEQPLAKDYSMDKVVLDSKLLSVYRGPEFDSLSSESVARISEMNFVVSKESNRMGYELIPSRPLKALEIITGPVQPGSVQLTPSGKMVVLMRDAHTTGGYARILQLDASSINALSQLRTGDSFRWNLLDGH